MVIEKWCFPNKTKPELVPADTRKDQKGEKELSFCL